QSGRGNHVTGKVRCQNVQNRGLPQKLVLHLYRLKTRTLSTLMSLPRWNIPFGVRLFGDLHACTARCTRRSEPGPATDLVHAGPDGTYPGQGPCEVRPGGRRSDG